jgi:hypothetical protein
MRIASRLRTRVLTLAALLAVLVVVAAACGSSNKSSPSPSGSKGGSASPTSSAATAAQIKTNWETFFAGTTPAARKIGLLQQGQQFAQIINAQAGLPIAKSTRAIVSSVNVTSASTATVKYSITLAGKTALPNQTGQAVLENGVWKVGDSSFTALLGLEGVKVPMPSGSSSTASGSGY